MERLVVVVLFPVWMLGANLTSLDMLQIMPVWSHTFGHSPEDFPGLSAVARGKCSSYAGIKLNVGMKLEPINRTAIEVSAFQRKSACRYIRVDSFGSQQTQ